MNYFVEYWCAPAGRWREATDEWGRDLAAATIPEAIAAARELQMRGLTVRVIDAAGRPVWM